MAKLRTLYRIHAADDPSSSKFLTRAFAVVARYEALARTTSGSQGAVTHAVFDWLVGTFGAQAECFASPLNCYLPHFCSAFPDVDAHFGSMGSFYSAPFVTIRGVFECNPPFTSDVMLECIKTCIHACREADRADETIPPAERKPLVFVVFTPAWDDDEYVRLAKRAPECTTSVRVSKRDHEYRDGMQHAVDRTVWRANVDSLVFVVQNRASAGILDLAASPALRQRFAADLVGHMRRREDESSPALCPSLVDVYSGHPHEVKPTVTS